MTALAWVFGVIILLGLGVIVIEVREWMEGDGK